MAVEGYHAATIGQAILALNDKALIEEINQLAMQKNCRISICHHRNKDKKNEIRFIVEPTAVNAKTILTDIDT